MYDGLRRAYARARTWPVVGGALSRAVWAAKGALGRPVAVVRGAPAPAARPPRRTAPPPPGDTRLLVALAAIQGLQDRLARAEGRHLPPSIPTDGRVPRPGSVSVVVSTLDRAAWLDRCLSGLAYQRHSDFEVLVVAGPSTDDTQAVLARHAPRVRVLRCGEANLSASRNIGLAAAEGEVVAFLDDDAVPEPDWLQRLSTAYQNPQVGGVGGAIWDGTGVTYQCRAVQADRLGRTLQVGALSQARLDAPGKGMERYLSLTGANSSFRRQALLDIGGFDEAYTYFLDETDVCLRLAEAGWRLEFVADAEVHHAYAPSAQRRADHLPLSLVAPVRSTAYFACRNGLERHGLAAVADHLQAYADELRRDIAWRCDQGLSDAALSRGLAGEVDSALAQGVEAALAGPRRLLRPAAPQRTLSSRASAPVLRPAGQRLRLCLLSQDYPGQDHGGAPPGGVAVWTKALAEALAARGHEVSVMARAGAAPPSVSFEAVSGAGVWVHRVGSLQQPLRQAGLLAGLPASVAAPAQAIAAEVARVAPRRQFDLVAGPLWDLEPAALVGSPWPTAVSLHTACAQMTPFKPEWTGEYRRLHADRVAAGERRLLQACPYVLANSRAAARDIGAALDLPDLPARATVIAHGLPDLRRGVEPRPPVDGGVEILFVGRLELRKGFDVLLDAATALLSLDADARLTLVGEEVAGEAGSVRDRFMAEHAGASWLTRVRFEGPLPRADLLTRYAGCDVVAVPSRYESFGLTALEAMIFAKPCVASRVGGLCEVVEDGVTGRLVAPDDPASLASALLALVRSKALRARMGEAGRRRYEALFTAEAMAAAYETWARSVIGRSARLAAE
jgi:glycogen synthase